MSLDEPGPLPRVHVHPPATIIVTVFRVAGRAFGGFGRRLEPLGVAVLPAPDEELPLPDASVDVVLNRHGRLVAREVARVLRSAERC